MEPRQNSCSRPQSQSGHEGHAAGRAAAAWGLPQGLDLKPRTQLHRRRKLLSSGAGRELDSGEPARGMLHGLGLGDSDCLAALRRRPQGTQEAPPGLTASPRMTVFSF